MPMSLSHRTIIRLFALPLALAATLACGCADGTWQLDFAENPELLEALFCVR